MKLDITLSCCTGESNVFFFVFVSPGRTASVYVTILATVERYIVVVFPVQSKQWLTPAKCRLYLVLVGFLSVLLNISLIINAAVSTVEEDDIFPPDTHVENFLYIFKDTHLTNHEISELLVFINYVAPFPLLLIFNGLLYRSVRI